MERDESLESSPEGVETTSDEERIQRMANARIEPVLAEDSVQLAPGSSSERLPGLQTVNPDASAERPLEPAAEHTVGGMPGDNPPADKQPAGFGTSEEKPAGMSAANSLTFTLKPAFVSRELVTLRPDVAGMVASYARVAGRVLGRPWRRSSLFFTSPQPNEGSTATAVNVATMLSRSAESTLLVELQLSEAGLWSLFGRPPVKFGLEEALRGHVTFEDCLYRIAGEKLDVLLVKQAISIEETEHLSGALNDFLEWAEERFAWLIVDCPPVLVPAWTRWFDLNADPVVLVAGSDRTKKHELRKVAHRLGDRLSGAILNESPRVQRVG
jgi:Mrp family chromosome partitioning ATPase